MSSSYYSEEDMCNMWSDRKCAEFENAVKSVIPDPEYAVQFAKALAYDIVCGEEGHTFMKDFRLTDDHALCYHALENKAYDKDVEEAYDRHCTDRMLTAYSDEY